MCTFGVMRPSPVRHNLARLRLELGLQQQGMANLAGGCSRELIKSVELGRKPLTKRLAETIFLATGVSAKWLLDNDLTAPIVDDWDQPYTRETFEKAKAGDDPFPDGEAAALARGTLAHQFEFLYAAYLSAEKKGVKTAALFRLRLARTIEVLEQDFGYEPFVYKTHNVLDGFCEAIAAHSPIMLPKEPARRQDRTAGGG